jgi:hypothetical protein
LRSVQEYRVRACIEHSKGAEPWKLHKNEEKSFKSAPNKIDRKATPVLAFTTN